jgi:heparan-alpha-glucosaminide N-acetyltransferase
MGMKFRQNKQIYAIKNAAMHPLPKRLISIDVLRAITMLLMIFVNDTDGMTNIPGWIGHAEGKADTLGFADTIFPAFLFIVGLSLPFAIKNRIKSGQSFSKILVYILTRSAALLIMGVFHVNLEEYSSKVAILSKPVWAILATTAFFMIWLDYPATLSKVKRYSLMGAGIVMLIVLALIFRSTDPENPTMDTSWWGILGIIGWSYLVCALIYLLTRGRLWMLTTAFVVFLTINICLHAHLMHGWLWIIGDASAVTLTMGGILISELYAWLSEHGKTGRIWAIFTTSGVAAIILGFVLRHHTGGISKIKSTPAWVLVCSGITILVFELLIYLVDIKGKKDWFKWIRPAGTSTLTCYLIPYYQYFLLKLCHIRYPDFIDNGLIGLLRSAVTALLIVLLVGVMEKRHLRLKI